MPRLSTIRIAGWKSIREIDPPLELGPLNVLIGANGSGKSNLVSFFRMIGELAGRRLQEYVARSGGPESILHHGLRFTRDIKAELEFDVASAEYRYSFQLTYAVPNLLIFANEELSPCKGGPTETHEIWTNSGFHAESGLNRPDASPWESPIDGTILDTAGYFNRFQTYHFHDTSETARLRQPGYIEANQRLYSDGANLAAMLFLYRVARPRIYQRIVSTFRHVMPMFDDFVLEPQRLNPHNILLNWRKRGSDYLFGPHQLSDGSLRAMALITLFLQPPEDLPALIVVDEPELGLHPHAIEIIAGLIRAASLRTQVILTTQSTTFLEHFEPEEIIAVDDEQGQSVFRHLDQERLQYWLKDYSVGELWERNVLGGGPLA
ncbi:MAG: AAA family ATPase [Isosphaeraceae bacterium]